MKCNTCKSEVSFIKRYADGTEICENCGGYSRASGARTNSILTRHSTRIRSDQAKHESDMTVPHTYDKASRKVKPNPDFLKQYPDKAREYFNNQELKKAGYGNLIKKENK